MNRDQIGEGIVLNLFYKFWISLCAYFFLETDKLDDDKMHIVNKHTSATSSSSPLQLFEIFRARLWLNLVKKHPIQKYRDEH